MKTPKEIQMAVSKLIPEASVSLDQSDSPKGSSWLDINFKNQLITIECSPSLGFGFYSSNDNSFGLGPDEVYRDVDSLFRRLNMFLFENKHDIKLKELRELLGITQDDLSTSSGQKQPSISKLESRNDIQLSSLENFVKALGGSLEIKAHFDEFDVPIDLSSSKKP